MPVFPVITIRELDFKNSITAIKLFLMILNLYLTSEGSQSKEVLTSDFEVCPALKLKFYIF